jgi:hypothetical protein
MKQVTLSILLVTAMMLAMMGGCNQTLSQKAQLLESTDYAFTGAIKVATILKPMFTPQEDADANVIIHAGQKSLNDEAAWLKNPVGPEPGIDDALTATTKLLAMSKGKAVKQ